MECDPKLANVYKTVYARTQAICFWHTFLKFVKIARSHIFISLPQILTNLRIFTEFDMINREERLIFV